MKKFFNIIIVSFIPTLCMYIIVGNMFIAQTEEKWVQFFTIFSFSFVITFAFAVLISRIEKLKKQVIDIEVKLEKIEQKLNNA